MASIEKRETKKGVSFRITISLGYDTKGKKLTQKETFIPDPNLTPKQQEKQAKIFATQFEQKVLNGHYHNEKMTLSEFTEKWLSEYVSTLSIRTYSDYKSVLEQRILPKIGHLQLTKISITTINEFYKSLSKDGARYDKKAGTYANGTLQKTNTALSSLFSYAVRLEIIESNPCHKAIKPRKTIETKKEVKDGVLYIKHSLENEKKLVCFTLEQAKLFLDALDMEYTLLYKNRKRKNKDGTVIDIKPYIVKKKVPLQFKVLFNIAIFGGLRRGDG